MKEIMKSLKDNAISRLKNPIVGAFALSWTILNINGLSLFLLGDTPTKIEIIKHKNWMLTDDFLIPLSIAIIYLIVLPLLNMVYELINDGLINFYRSKKKNDRDKKLAIQKKETVIAEIESDISYLQKLKDKDIDRWLEEKRKRNEEFIAQKALYSKLVGDSSNDQRTARNEIAKINKNNDELESQKSKLEKNQQEKKAIVERTTDQIEKTLKNIENNGGNENISSSDINDIRRILDSLRAEFLIWDDDIPF